MKYPINFQKLKQDNAVIEAKKFTKSQFWWVEKKNQANEAFLFDVKTKEIYSSDVETLTYLINDTFSQYRFWYLGKSGEDQILWDSKTKLLWTVYSKSDLYRNEVKGKLATFIKNGMNGWHLPSGSELSNFVKSEENPWRSAKTNYNLFQKQFWHVLEGRIDLNNCSCTDMGSYNTSPVIAVNSDLKTTSFLNVLKNNFLVCLNGLVIFNLIEINNLWANKTYEEIVLDLEQKGWTLRSGKDDFKEKIESLRVIELFKEMDYRSVRLPRLEEAQFTDVNKGMWEFWGMDEAELKKEGVVARNPELDIKTYNVAIDFGTSSTVVAVENNGRPELFRIGVRDFYEAATSAHYENPTVLEFVDFQAFLKTWQSESYRPETSWSDVRCSHEAQNNFRNNQGNPSLVSSIFPKMKQWALRDTNDVRLKIIDQERFEFELVPLSPTNPIKGKKLVVSQDDNFDPIELYAWFLGMTINWRSLTRGIFLKYYMTFPVAYPKDVKEKILASFRRGLHRSMPETLVSQDKFHKGFQLKEIASEPAAYAASALQILDIEPTIEGVAYGVFDFGGGTTDFDYGYYRWATAEEEDLDGTERVLEHVAAQGDKFLGGENLLENLAFRVFCHNIDICRKEQVAFTCPLDATPMAGTELLLDRTQAAQTNMIMLMAKLRPFWETGKSDTNDETIELLNRNGEKKRCTLKIPVDELNVYLSERITKGIANFFAGMQEAFNDEIPEKIHVLLAGNSSRSKWVSVSAFEEMGTFIFGEDAPEFEIHLPLEADEKDLYRPTAKTGVALGLLQLCDGGAISLVTRKQTHDDEASFNHFVGRIRQDKFQIALKRGADYDEWHELSPVGKGGVTYLYHTQSPLALHGEMKKGDSELKQVRLDFSGDTTGHRVFVKATKPNEIEVCSAESADSLQKGTFENLQTINIT